MARSGVKALFHIAGFAMLLHLVLGAIALGRIRSENVRNGLFGVPNRALGTSDSIRLMRVRYYFPVVRLPDGTSDLDGATKAAILVARTCGFVFLAAILGFFAAAFVTAVS